LVGGGTPTKEEVEKYLIETVTSTSEEKSQSMTTEISPLADSVEMTKIFLPNHICRKNAARLLLGVLVPPMDFISNYRFK
jgi:hypothetical protein